MGEKIAWRGTLILEDRLQSESTVVAENGFIVEITKRRRIAGIKVHDWGADYISPGFVDLHVHGGDGADFMDGILDAIRTAARAHLRRGTTTLFPTTTTGSPEQIARMLSACREYRDQWQPAHGARVEGIHLYGPYFAETKVGCHAKEGRRNPLPAEYRRYFESGMVRIATCAAELPGAAAFYRAAVRAGCLVTCGHSEATWRDMEIGFAAGLRHVDHFWCAMSSVPSLRAKHGTPMQASMAEFVLANPEMSTEVISDGQHLSPELLRFAYQMLGPDRLCLVTDANRALGMPAGEYRFGPNEDGAWFQSNGKVGFTAAGLASSVVGLDEMVRGMAKASAAPLPEVVRMASLTPARRAGLKDRGKLVVGQRADLLRLSPKLRVMGPPVVDGEFLG
ncbi:MAG: N-acetylglucosamine-6-phosphate deacetylase [Bryobacter sp.]